MKGDNGGAVELWRRSRLSGMTDAGIEFNNDKRQVQVPLKNLKAAGSDILEVKHEGCKSIVFPSGKAEHHT